MITRQEIFNIVDLFTSQSTINFYENIFDNLDLSFIPEFIESKRGPQKVIHVTLLLERLLL